MNKPAARILIVDDELANRKLLEVLLTHEGYATASAASGDEALALIGEQPPDLILLDVMMPTLNGYEVARILKAHPLSLHIPIILISALSDRAARLAGLDAGAEDFISKPFHRDELRLRVRNLLRLKSVGDEVRDNSLLLEENVQAHTIDLQRFRTAMDATADVLALVDRDTMRYIEVNAAGCRLCGYSREELLSMSPAQLFDAEAGQMERDFDAIIAGDTRSETRESMLRRKDGSEVCVEVNRQALRTPDGWTIVSVGRDITERKAAEARLQQLANYDPLTHLPNRRLFQESLAKAIEQADVLNLQAVLLFLDVDNFKDINDTLGHAVGDELLRGISERLLATTYGRDSVGRLGGDEFGIILMTPHDPELAVNVAQKIHDSLAVPFKLSGHTVATSVSIGITMYPTDTTDVDALARYADMAMYEAKRSGRNTSRFYTAAMNQRVSEKLELVAALREALARSEFVLHYQPKVSLRTGRWTGVEALLRWERPGHGLVPPYKFIPALEESGLIVPVGEWIVAAACRQLVEWRPIGMGELPIAINVSALQIAPRQVSSAARATAGGAGGATETIDLPPMIAACLAEHGLPASLLEVEITESVVMADAEHSIKVLQQLREMGVALSVDDFGTGYSSLSYLRRLPLQAVKIDGSFIRDLPEGTEDGSISIAIIELAHRLKLKVIAECVETREQAQFLKDHDCDEAQGYHFAKPMSADALASVWKETGGDFSRLIAP